MKCDKLKDYSIIDIEAIDDERYKKEKAPGKFVPESRVYLKSEVDTAIAELKRENRKLKRALWLSRAKAYRYIAELLTCFNPDYVRNRKMFTPNNLQQKQMNSLEWARLMLKVESKCLKKAEEYK